MPIIYRQNGAAGRGIWRTVGADRIRPQPRTIESFGEWYDVGRYLVHPTALFRYVRADAIRPYSGVWKTGACAKTHAENK